MNPHETALAFGRALKSHPDLAPVAVYAHDTEILPNLTSQRPDEVVLPCVTIKVQFEGLVGSQLIGRGKVEICVRSQADDDSSALHTSRERAARAVMADFAGLTAAFDSAGAVALCGRPALISNDPDVEARAYHTPLTYRAGVQELSSSSGLPPVGGGLL